VFQWYANLFIFSSCKVTYLFHRMCSWQSEIKWRFIRGGGKGGRERARGRRTKEEETSLSHGQWWPDSNRSKLRPAPPEQLPVHRHAPPFVPYLTLPPHLFNGVCWAWLEGAHF
jgi:hypothetical protein